MMTGRGFVSRKLFLALVLVALGADALSANQAVQTGEDKERWFAEVRATKRVAALLIQDPVTVDGRLEEPQWNLAEPARDFYQQVPVLCQNSALLK